LTCRELVRFLAGYLYGELGSGERAEFDRHLANCPSCVAYMESYRTTRALAKVAMTEPAAAVPADVPDELVQAVLAASRRRRGRS
jgi:anti-sigma factor RsiW